MPIHHQDHRIRGTGLEESSLITEVGSIHVVCDVKLSLEEVKELSVLPAVKISPFTALVLALPASTLAQTFADGYSLHFVPGKAINLPDPPRKTLWIYEAVIHLRQSKVLEGSMTSGQGGRGPCSSDLWGWSGSVPHIRS